MKIQETPKLHKPYSVGSYNKIKRDGQRIRISEGCPNRCGYCRESIENGVEPIYYPIPEIVRNNVTITDMNLIYKPRALDIINKLGSKRVDGKVVYYELICGIDYRYLTSGIAQALHDNRFIKVRIAWDHSLNQQKFVKEAITKLIKSGYREKQLTVFMICNWKISYYDNRMKMDLCKVWGVKVADCWFDNQLSPNIKPIHWKPEHIKKFRRKVREHNQIINFAIFPEIKSISPNEITLDNLMEATQDEENYLED